MEAMTLQVEGKLRKGVVVQEGDESQFFFANNDGGLACVRLKFSQNAVRATGVIFVVPKPILTAVLNGTP